MKKTLLYIIALLFISVSVLAQNPSKLMREGMLEYKKGNFENSISKYNEAIKKGADKNLAHYNIGAAYYKADKADSALMHWQSVATTDDNKELLARSWHNIGNSMVKQGSLDKAVDAYKNALKLNPNDEDTRYNLAYSQRRLQQQQQQQKQEQKQEEKKEEKEEPKQDDKPDPKDDLNKEEAEKILKAMDNKEKDLHKGKKQEGDPRTPSKDW